MYVCVSERDLKPQWKSVAEIPLFSIIYHFIDLSIKTVKCAVHELYCFPPPLLVCSLGHPELSFCQQTTNHFLQTPVTILTDNTLRTVAIN